MSNSDLTDPFLDFSINESTAFYSGYTELRNLQSYFKKRSQIELEYSHRIKELEKSIMQQQGWISAQSMTSCSLDQSTVAILSASNRLAETCGQIETTVKVCRASYKSKLIEIARNKCTALAKELAKKHDKEDSLKQQIEFKTTDASYRRQVQILDECRNEFMAFVDCAMGDISNIENERLQTIHSCMSLFAKEAGLGSKSSALVYETLQVQTASVDIPSDIAVCCDSLRQQWPILPQVVYTHPLFKAPLSNLSFGLPIEFVFRQTSQSVPPVLSACIEAIEKRGLDREGLYRLSGKAKDVIDLRNALERDPTSVALDSDAVEVNVICAVVKMYLRELPLPLFPFPQKERVEYSGFLASNSGLGETERIAKLRSIYKYIGSLPYGFVRQAVLVYIINHLSKVASNSDQNKMTASNLALIFGPMLFDPVEALSGTEPTPQSLASGFANLFKSNQSGPSPQLSQLEIFKSNMGLEDLINLKDKILVAELEVSPSRGRSGSAVSIPTGLPARLDSLPSGTSPAGSLTVPEDGMTRSSSFDSGLNVPQTIPRRGSSRSGSLSPLPRE